MNIETGKVRNLSKGVMLQGEALTSDSPPMQIFKAGGLDSFMKQELDAGKA